MSHTDAHLFRLCQPSGRGTAHSRAVAQTAVGLRMMALHPELEPAAKACMTMLVGTFTKVHRHVEMVDERFRAGEGQYGVVGEMGTAAEHLHLVVILDAVRSAFIRTAGNVADGFADQTILHTLHSLWLQR